MIYEGFPKRLAQLRQEKGVSARDMSLSLGQSESYINKIENNYAMPSMQGFFYICEFLGVTPAEFFDEKEDCLLSLLRHYNMFMNPTTIFDGPPPFNKGGFL